MYEEINGSILIISHQERILEIADKIVVIAGGRITEERPEGRDNAQADVR